MPDPDPNDLTAKIVAAAAAPKSVTTDNLTVQTQSITDLIAANEYLRKRASVAKRRTFGRQIKFLPPGSV